MHSHMFTVARNSVDNDSIVAVICFKSDHGYDKRDDSKSLLDALKEVVTQCINDCDRETMKIFEYAEYDLNIGDLASHGIPFAVQQGLNAKGFYDLGINILDSATNWVYDTQLVDEKKCLQSP